MKKTILIMALMSSSAFAVAATTHSAQAEDKVLCNADYVDSNSNEITNVITITQNLNKKITIVAKATHGGAETKLAISTVKKFKLTKDMPTVDYDVMVDMVNRSKRTDVLPVDYFNARFLYTKKDGNEETALVLVDGIKNNKIHYSFITDMAWSYGFCK